MIPIFEVFGKQISPYTIMILIGIFAAGITAVLLVKRDGERDIYIIEPLLYIGIGVVLGGSLLYALTKAETLYHVIASGFWLRSLDHFIAAFREVFLGSVFYGGMLGGLLAGFIYCRVKRQSYFEYTDVLAVVVPLFHIFGRVGCFLVGCCYGIESECGLIYHYSPIVEANGVMRFPVQLVEAGLNAAIFAVLLYLYLKGVFRYRLVYFYLGIYAVGRFALEYFRGDIIRGFVGALSTSQFISILLLAGVIISYICYKNKISKMART